MPSSPNQTLGQRLPNSDALATTNQVVARREVVLRLVPPPTDEQLRAMAAGPRRVSWEGEIPDHVNQRVSKSCCVFHKRKLFGESSSDESSTSSSDNDDDDAAHRQPHGGDDEGCGPHDGCKKHHHHRRPKCTKEHCYCGTRFH